MPLTDEQKLSYIKASFRDAIAAVKTLGSAYTLIDGITPGQLKAVISGKLEGYADVAGDVSTEQSTLETDLDALADEVTNL